MAGNFVVTVVCGLAGFSFLSIGFMDKQKADPATLWTGKVINPDSLRNVEKWNEEVGNLLMGYSIFWLLAALCSFISTWIPWLSIGTVACICLAVVATVGVIIRFRQLEKNYHVRYIKF